MFPVQSPYNHIYQDPVIKGEMIMAMNLRETWTVIHGMVFGFIFLLGFSGAL